MVHNGIIENFQELKAELTGLGYGFESQTDTEVVAILVTRYLDEGVDARARRWRRRCRGSKARSRSSCCSPASPIC